MTDEYPQLESRVFALIKRGEFSEEEFNECALAIFRFQRAQNQPYENYCRHLGVPPAAVRTMTLPFSEPT